VISDEGKKLESRKPSFPVQADWGRRRRRERAGRSGKKKVARGFTVPFYPRIERGIAGWEMGEPHVITVERPGACGFLAQTAIFCTASKDRRRWPRVERAAKLGKLCRGNSIEGFEFPLSHSARY